MFLGEGIDDEGLDFCLATLFLVNQPVTKSPTSGHRKRTGSVLISPHDLARLAKGYQTVIKVHITRLFGC